MSTPAAPLVNQPTAAPTRKWTFDAVAQVLTAVVGIAGLVVGDIDISEGDVATFSAALVTVVVFVGKIVGYFTKDRSNE